MPRREFTAKIKVAAFDRAGGCKVCGEPVRCKGLCGLHYERARNGRPMGAPRRPYRGETLRWLRANACFPGNECLIWPFGKRTDWYATVAMPDGKFSKAHRVMCMLAHGAPYDGQVAMHSCDNKRCVNPNHLSWGSPQENAVGAALSGALPRGEAAAHAKLSEADVRAMREARKGGATYSELGRAYGISKGAIWHAVNGTQWRHVK